MSTDPGGKPPAVPGEPIDLEALEPAAPADAALSTAASATPDIRPIPVAASASTPIASSTPMFSPPVTPPASQPANVAEPRPAPGDSGAAPRELLPPAMVGWFLAIIGLATLLSFYLLGGGAGFEPIDCWVAQTAREMREAGDWITPRFSGETRMQKSPGAYWAVMLTSLARGTPVDTISARLPNAIFAVLLVGVIFLLTRAIAGDRAAIFAGFASACSTLVLYWSHRAASDLGLTAWMTLSLACFWIAINATRSLAAQRGLWLLGYFAAGVAMVYKMPMPLVCVGLPMLTYILICRRWSVLARRVHLAGIGLFCLPWLPWMIAVLLREPTAWDKWRVEFLDRFTGALPNVESQFAPQFYFMYLLPPLMYCLPFSLSLPAALAHVFRGAPGASRDGLWFLGLWFFSLFAFFTASVGKELRYLLPAIPPLFVLLGIELARFFDPRRPHTPKLDLLGARAVWALVPIGFVAGALGVRKWFKEYGQYGLAHSGEMWLAYGVTALIFVTGAALAAWLYLRRREHQSFAALIGTMCVAWLWIWPNVMPIFASQKPFIDFATQLRTRLPQEILSGGVIRHVGSQDSRVNWYGDVRFPRVIDQLELLERQGGRRSLEFEKRAIAEEMIARLAAPDLYLLAATRFDYVRFQQQGGLELARAGRELPRTYLWLQSQVGPKSRHYVLFGNQPPPWGEPPLTPPSEELQKARDQIRELLPRSADTQTPAAVQPSASVPPKSAVTQPTPPPAAATAPAPVAADDENGAAPGDESAAPQDDSAETPPPASEPSG